MGDPWSEGQASERPVHTVYLSSYLIGRYEVTNQEYADTLNWANAQGDLIHVNNNTVYQYGTGTSYPYCDTVQSSPYNYSRLTWDGSTFGVVTNKEAHPVIFVSWYGAAAYCNWRSAMEGRPLCYDYATWACDFNAPGYRLPTEAEWEKAAAWDPIEQRHYRFGEHSDGGGPGSLSQNRANYLNSGDPYGPGGNPQTTPVGFYNGELHYKVDFDWPGSQTEYQTQDAKSYYGCYDMSGNDWEWCHDWYDQDYYSAYPPTEWPDNPAGPATGTYRVERGGSWDNPVSELRSARRDWSYGPSGRGYNLGLRCVLLSQGDINCEDLEGYDYGTVLAGDCSLVQNWVLINEGTEVLTGTVSLAGPDAVEFELTQGSGAFTLQPDETLDVAVRFCPNSLGVKSATLHIESNDPDENPCDLPLSGEGTGPDINCEELAGYDWGVISGEYSDVQYWTISNLGDGLLDGEVSLTGPDAASFEITIGAGTFSIGAGGTHTVGRAPLLRQWWREERHIAHHQQRPRRACMRSVAER